MPSQGLRILCDLRMPRRLRKWYGLTVVFAAITAIDVFAVDDMALGGEYFSSSAARSSIARSPSKSAPLWASIDSPASPSSFIRSFSSTRPTASEKTTPFPALSVSGKAIPSPIPSASNKAKPSPAPSSAPPPVRASAPWATPSAMGRFFPALLTDRSGILWAGTKEAGLWRFDPHDPNAAWTVFTRKSTGGSPEPDGPRLSSSVDARPWLGDNAIYALAEDHQGRLWVGHLRHGVSVFNGVAWRNYPGPHGPGADRVFALGVHPFDGSVWMGTPAGVGVYHPDSDTWSTHGPAEGLPPSGIRALAFDALRGDVYLGTEMHGVVRGERRPDGGWHWMAVPVPDRFPARAGHPSSPGPRSVTRSWPLPNTPVGSGLPSAQINALAVARDGTVYAGTANGLAHSFDGGLTWTYRRGKDWARRVRGLYRPPEPCEVIPPKDVWLARDYVYALAFDDRDRLWIGFWQAGVQVWDPRARWVETPRLDEVSPLSSDASPSAAPPSTSPPSRPAPGKAPSGSVPSKAPAATVDPRRANAPYRWATAFATLPSGDTIVATHAHGLLRSSISGVFRTPVPTRRGWNPDGRSSAKDAVARAATDASPALSAPPHPTPPPPLTPKERADWMHRLRAIPPARGASSSWPRALPDDWNTAGDWIGRYGRYWIMLGALNAPRNYRWGAGWEDVRYHHRIGPHHRPPDSIRHWVHWIRTTDRRSLELPPAYHHSRMVKGWAKPKEARRQSEWDDHGEAYPFEFDGPHMYCNLDIPEGDFILSLYNFNKDGLQGHNRFRDYAIYLRPLPSDAPWRSVDGVENRPVVARARMHHFRGGVWKRFLIRGPSRWTLEMRRNGSYNTILAGMALDLIDPFPAPYFKTPEDWARVYRADHGESENRRPDSLPFHDATADSAPAWEALERELDAVSRRHPSAYADIAYPLRMAMLRSWPSAPADATTPSDADGASTEPLPPVLRARLAWFAGYGADYDDAVRAMGLTPARDIEKAQRWDGASYSHYGEGYSMIAAHVAENGLNHYAPGVGDASPLSRISPLTPTAPPALSGHGIHGNPKQRGEDVESVDGEGPPPMRPSARDPRPDDDLRPDAPFPH